MQPSLKPKTVLLTIFLSTLLISGSSWAGWWIYKDWKLNQIKDSKYLVQALAVVTLNPSKNYIDEPLKPAAVAEWLNLSIDEPINLWKVHTKTFERKLLTHKPIKNAKVTKIFPSTLFVGIELRKPFALIGNRTNLAVDREGVLFPLVPYYTPKNLPKVYLSTKKHFELALKIFDYITQKKLNVDLLDVEKSDTTSFGEREIVFQHETNYVRLNPDHWQEGVDNYLKIKDLQKNVIDLRSRSLALTGGFE